MTSPDLQGDANRFPLLQAQRPVWFGHMIGEAKSAYNIGQYTELAGRLDTAAFRAAAGHVVRRTEALRLRFRSDGEAVWQEIAAPEADPLPVVDLSQQLHPETEAVAFIEAAIRRPFRLDREPPFRWSLVKARADRWFWCQVYHHAALDAQSAWIVSGRVAGAYTELRRAGTHAAEPDGAVAALSREEQAYRGSGRFAEDEAFWTTLLNGCERMRCWTSAPPERADTPVVRETVHLSDEASAGIRLLAQEAGIGTGHLLMAAAALVQAMHQREQDIVLGVPLLGRPARSARAYPGMTSNEGHLRLRVTPDGTFRDLAGHVARQMRLAVRHQACRYEDVRAALGLRADDPDLFSLSVNIMPFVSELEFDGLEARSHYVSYGPVRDLSLSLFDHAVHKTLRIDLDGNPDLHARSDVSRHLRSILSILEQAARTGGRAPLAAFALTDGVPRSGAAQPAGTPALAATVPDLIAMGIGDGRAVAVTDGARSMTRADLEARSNALARLLIRKGAGPEVVVAIGSERDPTLAVAVLGVLKAGAACLPLDPRHPVERSADLLRSGNAALLVRTRAFGSALDHEIPTIVIDDDAVEAERAASDDSALADDERLRPLHAHNLAFVIHTSGSTGRPKGVGLTHANVVNKLSDQTSLWNVGPSSRFALSSSLSFDPSIHQLLLPLAVGGTCVLAAPEDMGDAGAFWDRIVDTGVTHLDVVPTFAEVLAAHRLSEAPDLRVFILGGEELKPRLLRDLRRLQPTSRFFNMYGPTETCIDAAGMELADGAGADGVPIGSPLRNYRVYVLDACLRPLPDAVVGEIYIAGAGLARGYLGRPDLTAERFLACPFGGPGERMYRTGDLGRRRPDGTIEFVGRIDDQIKLRGIRIEPGEIEAALRAQPGVHQAVVDARGTAEHRRLVGYVSALPGTVLDGAQLRASVASVLPSHLVPTAVMVLDALPRMPNGKLDRRALPDPAPSGGGPRILPETGLEARLCKAFEALTSCPDVSVLDHFFALGGNSLLAMRLVALLRHEDGLHVPLRSIFAHPTPRALAAAIAGTGPGSDLDDPILCLRGEGESRPLFCVHAASGLAAVYRPLAERLDPGIPVYGFEARGVAQDEPPHESVSEMARCYVAAMRRIQSRGPYHLLGWSFGGVVAHEMTRILESEGDSVGLLLLIDSYFHDVEADAGSVVRERATAGWLPPAGHGGEPVAAGEMDPEGFPHSMSRLDPAWAERIRAFAARSGRLIARHRAGRVEAPVVFVRASDNTGGRRLRTMLCEIAAGPVPFEDLAAGHYDLFDPAHIGDLAAAVGRRLARALQGSSRTGF